MGRERDGSRLLAIDGVGAGELKGFHGVRRSIESRGMASGIGIARPHPGSKHPHYRFETIAQK